MPTLVLEPQTGRASTQPQVSTETFSASYTFVSSGWQSPYPDASQAWFWTPEWQAMEAEASEDIARGRVRRFLDEDEFSRAIDELLSDADI